MLKDLFHIAIFWGISVIVVGCGVNGAGVLPSAASASGSGKSALSAAPDGSTVGGGVKVSSINRGTAFNPADEPPIIPNGSGGLVRQPMVGVSYTSTRTTPKTFKGMGNQ